MFLYPSKRGEDLKNKFHKITHSRKKICTNYSVGSYYLLHCTYSTIVLNSKKNYVPCKHPITTINSIDPPQQVPYCTVERQREGHIFFTVT